MLLPYDILSALCDIMPDSRPLYLTCRYLHNISKDVSYWTKRGDDRISAWPPKLPTTHAPDTFAEFGNLAMIKHIMSSLVHDEQLEDTIAGNIINAACWHLQTDIFCYMSNWGYQITNSVCYEEFLGYAVATGQLGIVKRLIKQEHIFDVDHYPAIYKAVECNELKILKCMLPKQFADDMIISYLLPTACKYGYLDIVKYLTSLHSEDALRTGKYVQAASKYGRLDVVKYLVATGADILDQNNRAIRKAVDGGHLEVTKFLVSAGANIMACRGDVFGIRRREYSIEMMKYLASMGVNVEHLTAIKIQQLYENHDVSASDSMLYGASLARYPCVLTLKPVSDDKTLTEFRLDIPVGGISFRTEETEKTATITVTAKLSMQRK